MIPDDRRGPELEPPSLIVLAAGAATRLGQPKALAQLGPCTALEHLLNSWESAGESKVRAAVVLGADFERIAPRVPAPARVLEHTPWALGRTGSVQRAVQEYLHRDLLLASVDTPLVSASTLRTLLRVWRAAGSPARGWLAPATQPDPGRAARPGHPILVGRELLQKALELAPDAPLRHLRALADPLFLEVVQDSAIHDDLDTPEDLNRLRSRLDGSNRP